jgi:hypothetical protein
VGLKWNADPKVTFLDQFWSAILTYGFGINVGIPVKTPKTTVTKANVNQPKKLTNAPGTRVH